MRLNHIFLSLALVGVVTAGRPPTSQDQSTNRFSGSHGHNGHHRQDRAQNGTYNALVGGFFKGTGTAEVSDDAININATITTRDGLSGSVIAINLPVEGPYFSGEGMVMGRTLTIRGRVDAARASRLVATFFVDDGHTGRIVARLPSDQDPGDDGWNHSGKNDGGD
jgi:hypothetical protein